MAAKTLQDFTLSAVAAPDDFVVGYDTATSGGERRWTVSTLANAVSGVMNAQLDADIQNGVTNVSILSTSKVSAKAWVNFDGTTSPGTIRSSYNVTSVTKNGTGQYTINFATPMNNSNYCLTTTSTGDTATGKLSYEAGTYGQYRNQNSVRVSVINAATTNYTDAEGVYVQIFGN